MGLTLCSAAQGMASEVKELQVGKINQSMTSDTMVQFKKEIGAFEITAEQRELAKTNKAGYPVLDAGRGNPIG